MSVFFYNVFLALYGLAIRISALWNPKAKNWVKGRRGIFEKIRGELGAQSSDKSLGTIWIHCSSLGEFEQGRPIVERLRTLDERHRIVITFFSPSGYEARKLYRGADHVFYLPPDSKINAGKFLDCINPSLVIFVKYDYWYHYLNEIRKRKINCLLVSAVFRHDQAFFKWYGRLQRKMLNCFSQVFVQDEDSRKLLEAIHMINCIVAGDTRFDSVTATAEAFRPLPQIERFIGDKKCIVAGSTWKKDEEMLQQVFNELTDHHLRLIIAPHEIAPGHLHELKQRFPTSARCSQWSAGKGPAVNVLIIDNIGMLSSLYKYGYLTYVGGGFTKDGVHNVLEAAVYGKPVVFGRNYHKYKEAAELIHAGGAESFSRAEELYRAFLRLLTNEDAHQHKCLASKQYVRENKGATEKVIRYIQEKRLLTRW